MNCESFVADITTSFVVVFFSLLKSNFGFSLFLMKSKEVDFFILQLNC